MRKDPRRSSMVFLAENTSNLSTFPRHFAIKRASFNIDQVAEAHHEIEMMSTVSNKNIVKSLHCEVSRHEGQLGVSICTEYCGNNLWKRIKCGSTSGAGSRMLESEVVGVLLGVASALGYLHAQQPPIAFRNIHPQNILIHNQRTGPLMYKLCNFSKASTEAFECTNREEQQRVIDDLDQYRSLAFVAPEMVDPLSGVRIDEQVDMWALGVLLYSMMYMKLPFEATITTLSQKPRYHPQPTAAFSGCFQTILQHLLDPDPTTRWNIFSLINFLRFDDTIDRHLSTFCFTFTEYPDGWEEQTVFTVGRAVPSKKPPVSYEAGAAVTKVGQPAPEEAPLASAAPPPVSLEALANDPGFREALAILESCGDIDDPRIAKYRSAIIHQQTAMYATATGAPAPSAAPASAAPAAAPSPPSPGNDLDDLFGDPSPPESPAVHSDPLADAFSGAQVKPAGAPAAPAGGLINDLFAAPPAPTETQPSAIWAASSHPVNQPNPQTVDFFANPSAPQQQPQFDMFGQPAQPAFGQPAQPAYGQPAYGQPAFGQPAQPAYGGAAVFGAPGMAGSPPNQFNQDVPVIQKKANTGVKDPFADLF